MQTGDEAGYEAMREDGSSFFSEGELETAIAWESLASVGKA